MLTTGARTSYAKVLIAQENVMGSFVFSDADKRQIQFLGIAEEQVLSQMEILRRGAPYLKLNRPCTIGDGIKSISDDRLDKLITVFEESAPERSLVKFVPASGAATRMCRRLLRFNNHYDKIQRESVAAMAARGEKDCERLLTFMEGIRHFAFYDDLKSVMAKAGLDAEALIDEGQFKEIIDYLLTQKGLGYAELPKGLLKFHKYPHGNRTPFEEHLVGATAYVKGRNGICTIHFTVASEHQKTFEALFESVKAQYEDHYGVQFDVGFSVQERSTDTVAVDLENRPFRLSDGTILFRPGGHGALLENLNNLASDIIYIKNIDNVVPDRLKGDIFKWKKALGGYLIQVQEKIYSYLEGLSAGLVDEGLLESATEFAEKELCLPASSTQGLSSNEAKKNFLLDKFNRPIRVCGMVKNVGEPGGGPFWVEAADGSLSLQIVESAQVDVLSEEQQQMLTSSTHFNPVDIVCGVRDFKGNRFNLREYVDQDAVFISQKSKDGRELKALELPGLWNGAMAYWNTIFVEVPLITFNPVKTINDLLRKEHQ